MPIGSGVLAKTVNKAFRSAIWLRSARPSAAAITWAAPSAGAASAFQILRRSLAARRKRPEVQLAGENRTSPLHQQGGDPQKFGEGAVGHPGGRPVVERGEPVDGVGLAAQPLGVDKAGVASGDEAFKAGQARPKRLVKVGARAGCLWLESGGIPKSAGL